MTLSQEEILLSLVQGTSGSAWAKERKGWTRANASDSSETVEICKWDGVECDPVDKTTVIGINLSNSDLSATLPMQLGQLATLNSIILSQNLIRGGIPVELAKLQHLEILDLSENEVDGTLPDFASPLLRKLVLKNNRLSGTLPHDLGNRHERLQTFDVTHNSLTGPIPESIKTLESLDTFSLSENDFTGTIPSTLSESKGLQYLYLDNNHLMGTIPPALARSDSPLAEIWLQVNLLSGTIPAAIADLPDLFNFYVDGNKFTGTVPQELCRKELNEDFFQNVKDEEDRNYCESVACPVGHRSTYGVFPCVECEKRFFNPYIGREGQCIDMKPLDILIDLYTSTIGSATWVEKWDIKEKQYCSFFGVTCDNHQNIIGINLKGNNLHGSIPESIGFLRYLENLDLSDNEITGFLPSDLRWAPLEVLDVSGNKLRGIVPPMLCRQQGVNGNGEDGEFSCERIACPAGFYSSTGNGKIGAASSDDNQCIPCQHGGIYLGSKVCDPSSSSLVFTPPKHTPNPGTGSDMKDAAALMIGILISGLSIIIAVISVFRIRRYYMNRGIRIPQTIPVDTPEYI